MPTARATGPIPVSPVKTASDLTSSAQVDLPNSSPTVLTVSEPPAKLTARPVLDSHPNDGTPPRRQMTYASTAMSPRTPSLEPITPTSHSTTKTAQLLSTPARSSHHSPTALTPSTPIGNLTSPVRAPTPGASQHSSLALSPLATPSKFQRKKKVFIDATPHGDPFTPTSRHIVTTPAPAPSSDQTTSSVFATNVCGVNLVNANPLTVAEDSATPDSTSAMTVDRLDVFREILAPGPMQSHAGVGMIELEAVENGKVPIDTTVLGFDY